MATIWRRARGLLASAAALVALGGCSLPSFNLGAINLPGFGSSTEEGTPGFVRGFIGGIAIDEPRAGLIGRDILSAGGTAADAAVAMGFALGVTLPSRAGLGGGGACLVYEAERLEPEAIEFLPVSPASVPAIADRPSALPATVRGLFALHARYGRFRFEQITGPAERLAREGTPVSRAFARDLALVAGPLFADPQARAVFARNGAQPLQEGDTLVQPQLGALIGQIRSAGVGSMYQGALAEQLERAAAAAGGSMPESEMRAVLPRARAPLSRRIGNDMIYAASGADGSWATGAILAALAGPGRYQGSDAAGRAHALAEASARVLGEVARRRASGMGAGDDALSPERAAAVMAGYTADRASPAAMLGGRLPVLPASASFAVLDRNGMAVTCAFTMNNLFGTGRIAPGTGLLLAAAPGRGSVQPPLLAVLLAVNTNINRFRFAGAASGEDAAPAALADVAARTMLAAEPLASAITAPRVARGTADAVRAEPELPDAVRAGLAARGAPVTVASGGLGRVNAIDCPEFRPRREGGCTVVTDPRGPGLAVVE
ncbi:MAG: gamma-glutamyltransferase [Alphaproteobacteria bacterium]|nr:gamma-glutamyltransferase [Alphaproteobacteria bacterium]